MSGGRDPISGGRHPTSVRPHPAAERPRALWHPVPVAELCIGAGMVALTVGLARGGSASAGLPVVVGLGAIALGVLELTAREHLSGYRRHTALLAFLFAATIHGALVVLLPGRLIGAGALAIDLVVFGLACGLLDAAWRTRTAALTSTTGDDPDA
jgi:hypothetical protein